MPIYEYKCNSCGKRFEKIEKFSDAPLEVHEECGGPVERLLSAPALQFKGTGWYVTDYGRSNGGNSGKSESNKDSAKESKSDSSNSSSKGESSSKSSDSGSTSTASSTTTSSSDKK
jgi:putative FmdB family regulatory protein